MRVFTHLIRQLLTQHLVTWFFGPVRRRCGPRSHMKACVSDSWNSVVDKVVQIELFTFRLQILNVLIGLINQAVDGIHPFFHFI